MANTLIIPGTDFSGHKIETVSFDPVPPVPTLEIVWEWRTAAYSDPLATYTTPSSTNATKYMTAFGKGISATERQLACASTAYVDYPYAIKLPQGTTKVKVNATDKTAFYNGTGARIVWTKDVDSGASGEHAHKIKGIQRDDFNCSEVPVELSVPANADSFVLTLRFTDNQSYDSADACAEHYGISVEFMTT